MRAIKLAGFTLLVCLQAACSLMPTTTDSALPLLHLNPASLGADVSMAQRLQLTGSRHAWLRRLVATRTLDAQLQIDDHDLMLAGFALSHRLLMLQWDGSHLRVQQDTALHPPVDPERILRDIQLTYWPAPALRAALPAGWQLDDLPSARTLMHDGQAQVIIQYDGPDPWHGVASLDNRAEGYQLRITSTPQEP